jgi:integrase
VDDFDVQRSSDIGFPRVSGCTSSSSAWIRPGWHNYDVRHSYATAALEAGVPLKVVSERLGHASIAITGDVYSHVRPEVDQAAADLVAGLILGR